MREILSQIYIGLHVQYRYFCQILMKLGFARQGFEKYSNIKFHKSISCESRVVPCGSAGRHTYRHDEADSRFSQFCESA